MEVGPGARRRAWWHRLRRSPWPSVLPLRGGKRRALSAPSFFSTRSLPLHWLISRPSRTNRREGRGRPGRGRRLRVSVGRGGAREGRRGAGQEEKGRLHRQPERNSGRGKRREREGERKRGFSRRVGASHQCLGDAEKERAQDAGADGAVLTPHAALARPVAGLPPAVPTPRPRLVGPARVGAEDVPGAQRRGAPRARRQSASKALPSAPIPAPAQVPAGRRAPLARRGSHSPSAPLPLRPALRAPPHCRLGPETRTGVAFASPPLFRRARFPGRGAKPGHWSGPTFGRGLRLPCHVRSANVKDKAEPATGPSQTDGFGSCPKGLFRTY